MLREVLYDENSDVTVPCRNRRLFCRIFRSHHCLRSAVSLSFREGRGSYVLHIFIRYSCIYEACTSPAHNGSLMIRRFKHSNAIEIRDRVTFDFYTGLSQMYAELITQKSQTLLPQNVCTHTHTSVWGARCQVGRASASPVLSSDRLTTDGRWTGESFTNGGQSCPSSCLDNIL